MKGKRLVFFQMRNPPTFKVPPFKSKIRHALFDVWNINFTRKKDKKKAKQL